MISFFKYLSYICFLGSAFLFFKNWVDKDQNYYDSLNKTDTKKNGLSFKKNETENSEGIEKITPKTTIGHYYVNDTLVDGIYIYKDVFKKNKFQSKLTSMSELDIKKIENGMGYSELLYGQYRTVGGWVRMIDVTYYDDMFPEKDRGVYFVKSSAIHGINIYKDKFRKKKYNTKITAMKEIEVSKISNGMAYTKMLITSNYDLISGWVEIQYLELKEN